MPQRIVAIFGGTYDPPHVGHLAVASELLAAGPFDEVLLMVANEPWQKAGTRHITPAAVRLEMVAAAVEGHPGLVAADDEIRRGGPSYTVETVEELQAGGDVAISVVVGADALAGLDTWHRAADLAKLVDIVAVDRPGTSPSRPGPEWTVRSIAAPELAVSSTDIRARVAAGRPIDFLVTDPVRSVIDRRGLYRVSG